ncbi:hypothetical protein DDF62_23855 [Caulobacter radicis]|nr:hypothetical protein DDF62_23855 [Caulobacter radicis]
MAPSVAAKSTANEMDPVEAICQPRPPLPPRPPPPPPPPPAERSFSAPGCPPAWLPLAPASAEPVGVPAAAPP